MEWFVLHSGISSTKKLYFGRWMHGCHFRFRRDCFHPAVISWYLVAILMRYKIHMFYLFLYFKKNIHWVRIICNFYPFFWISSEAHFSSLNLWLHNLENKYHYFFSWFMTFMAFNWYQIWWCSVTSYLSKELVLYSTPK